MTKVTRAELALSTSIKLILDKQQPLCYNIITEKKGGEKNEKKHKAFVADTWQTKEYKTRKEANRKNKSWNDIR